MCISKNPNIHFLIETCLFAKNVNMKDLHDICLKAIANDLIRWGKTDAIKKLPFDIFSSILSEGNFTQIEDEILLLINKWSKSTNATHMETLGILESSGSKRSIIGPSVMWNCEYMKISRRKFKWMTRPVSNYIWTPLTRKLAP